MAEFNGIIIYFFLSFSPLWQSNAFYLLSAYCAQIPTTLFLLFPFYIYGQGVIILP